MKRCDDCGRPDLDGLYVCESIYCDNTYICEACVCKITINGVPQSFICKSCLELLTAEQEAPND